MSPRCLLAIVYVSAFAQSPRDDWKLKRLDLRKVLTTTLGDAALSPAEREQIYRVIDGKTVHDSFTDEQRTEERETVLRCRLGFLNLNPETSPQLVVEGPLFTCGAPGNCPLWIFLRDRGALRLVLTTGGNTFIVKTTLNLGYHDIATGWHMSALEMLFDVYRWDGSEYKRIDCYGAKWPQELQGAAPRVSSCP